MINNMFRAQKTSKKTRIKLYNTLALPALLHSSDNRIITERDTRRITTVEMKYIRNTAGYTWTDYKTNTEIAKELNVTPILEKIQDYWQNWIQHVNRMPCDRSTRITNNDRPKVRTRGDQ